MDHDDGRALEGNRVGGFAEKLAARWVWFAVLSLVVGGVVWVSAIVSVYKRPSEFLGRMIVEFNLTPEESASPGAYQREFEFLNSDRVLERALSKAKVEKRWKSTTPEALRALAETAEVEASDDYRKVRVEVYQTDAVLAAELAGLVISGYLDIKREELADELWKRDPDDILLRIAELSDRAELAFVKWQEAKRAAEAPGAEAPPPGSLEAAQAEFDQLDAEISQRRALKREVEEDGRDPKLLIFHELPQVAKVPSRPDIEAAKRAAVLRAALIGPAAALLVVVIVPSRRRGTSAA